MRLAIVCQMSHYKLLYITNLLVQGQDVSSLLYMWRHLPFRNIPFSLYTNLLFPIQPIHGPYVRTLITDVTKTVVK